MREPQALRSSLRGLGWARLIAATMVLAAGALLRYADGFHFDVLPFATAALAAGLISGILLVGSAHVIDLQRFAWLQIYVDVALVTGIIAASGGPRSVFRIPYAFSPRTIIVDDFRPASSPGLASSI